VHWTRSAHGPATNPFPFETNDPHWVTQSLCSLGSRVPLARASVLASATAYLGDARILRTWRRLFFESRLAGLLGEHQSAETMAAANLFAICDEHTSRSTSTSRAGHLGWARAHFGRAAECVAALLRPPVKAIDGVDRDRVQRPRAECAGAAWSVARKFPQRQSMRHSATFELALNENPQDFFNKPDFSLPRLPADLNGSERIGRGDFRQAIAHAQTMKAKTLELRAATRLARGGIPSAR